MDALLRYAAELEGAPSRALPPVEKWRPEKTGEIDIVIQRDGVWLHEGAPIARARLVRLLSTILRREGDAHFLVTPYEKLRISVEDCAFIAVAMRRQGARLIFATNLGDETSPDAARPIVFRESGAGKAPYVAVRGGLEARLSRAVFLELVAEGETRDIGGDEWFGVAAGGDFFPFERIKDWNAT